MSAPTLKLLPYAAPRRFIFIDPDTGYKYRAANKKDLFVQILNYRAQNRLEPIEALDLVLEHYWCTLPENAGSCETVKLKRGFMQTVQGGVALIKNFFYGEENMVGQEEADRRAKICIKCPHNFNPDKYFYEQWADEVAENSTFGKKSAHYGELFNCEVCTCPLRAKVFYKGPFVLNDEQKQKMKEVGCWQTEGES